MTKTLTEQWREGTLDNGFYYVMSGWSTSIEIRYLGEGFFEGNIKVIAPVPSYEDWHKVKDLGLCPDYTDHIEKWEDCARLTKKLDIATKALKEINKNYRFTVAQDVVYKALKEMEGVK